MAKHLIPISEQVAAELKLKKGQPVPLDALVGRPVTTAVGISKPSVQKDIDLKALNSRRLADRASLEIERLIVCKKSKNRLMPKF